MPKIEEEYIQTGKVYFLYREFPLVDIHGSALLASHTAICAGVQDAFWPMHDRLFAGQEANEWGGDVRQDFATFLTYARELQLDEDALRSCVQSNQHAERISGDYREALEAGVRSTPTFTVNGELLVGAQPYERWKTVLDAALRKAGVQP
jgi:protein-disulfide isomerase